MQTGPAFPPERDQVRQPVARDPTLPEQGVENYAPKDS